MKRLASILVALSGFPLGFEPVSVKAEVQHGGNQPQLEKTLPSHSEPSHKELAVLYNVREREKEIEKGVYETCNSLHLLPEVEKPSAQNNLCQDLRACLTKSSWHIVVSRSIILSKTFLRVLDPVCRAGSPAKLKII